MSKIPYLTWTNYSKTLHLQKSLGEMVSHFAGQNDRKRGSVAHLCNAVMIALRASYELWDTSYRYDWLRQVLSYKGNHIITFAIGKFITFAEQTHNICVANSSLKKALLPFGCNAFLEKALLFLPIIFVSTILIKSCFRRRRCWIRFQIRWQILRKLRDLRWAPSPSQWWVCQKAGL